MAENYEIKQVPTELNLEEIRRTFNELNLLLIRLGKLLDDHTDTLDTHTDTLSDNADTLDDHQDTLDDHETRITALEP